VSGRGNYPTRASATTEKSTPPRACCGLADVRARIHLWTDGRRGLLQGEAGRVLPGAPPGTEDPSTPAG